MSAEHARGNAEVRGLLREMLAQAPQARDQDELIAVIQKAGRYGVPFEFTHINQRVTAIVCLLLSVALFIVLNIFPSVIDERGIDTDWAVVTVVILLLTAGYAGFVIVSDRALINKVNKEILKADLMLDNGLRLLAINGAAEAESLQRFPEFRRGNYKREIEWMYAGPLALPRLATEWKLYKFHYVDEKTKRDSKGSTTTYHHYYRYGLLLPFAASDISITTAGSHSDGVRWKTESPVFERHYTVVAPDKITAARFLKPSVIVDLQELPTMFSNLSLQVLDKELLIACGDEDLLSLRSVSGIRDPVAFEAEIRKLNRPEKLRRLMKTIDNLAEHNL